ncbi:MAG: type I 3-dehydroquinate dehydratase [Phycisphaeraceae bacterium]|nr:type I 3-dehydroquinate dehydratase [Phycisphaerae bacterium]MBX3391425.1 type I 3-dehydroquinate dehydratase [Phycisphaeraceae bacterium]
MATLLCVPLTVHEPGGALDEARRAAEAGADLVEFRVDGFYVPEGNAPELADSLARMISRSPLPCIVTCRHVSEGGAFGGDDADRAVLIERLAAAAGRDQHPPRYLDVEFERYAASEELRGVVRDSARRPDAPGLVFSSHDFGGRPPDLARRLGRMRADPAASVLKIAYRARSLRDNLELFDILLERDRPTIALAMGEFGLASRVLAPKFGGFLTFASLSRESVTAPGQPTIEELVGRYRFRSIGPGTRVYGVAGWPVAQSLSPVIHNAGFEAIGHDGVYLPMPIAADESAPDASYASFKATVLAMMEHPRLDLSGLSVTIPHKQNLVRLAREQGWRLDPLSSLCGSANTLAISPSAEGPSASRSAAVFNTDARAAVECLRGVGVVPKGLHVGLIGAGGVAGAIGFALALGGASLTIFNRSAEAARNLADRISRETGATANGRDAAELTGRGRAAPWNRESPISVWINGSPVGMKHGPNPDGSPISPELIRNFPAGTAVLDTVYNPSRTPLIEHASQAGLVTIDGTAMFVRQACEQFAAWTGTNPPAGLFERLVTEALAT